MRKQYGVIDRNMYEVSEKYVSKEVYNIGIVTGRQKTTVNIVAGDNGVSAGSSLRWLRHRWCEVQSFLRDDCSAVDGTA